MAGPTPSVGNSMGVSLDALMAKFDQLIQATNAEAKALTSVASLIASAGQIPGTIAGDNAAPGKVGEYVIASVTGVAVANGTDASLVSITLSPGDWDVSGAAVYSTGTSTSSTYFLYGVSATSGSLPSYAQGGYGQYNVNIGASGALSIQAPLIRMSSTVSFTAYGVGLVAYTGSVTATAVIRARRVR